jgi:hypothetical protein
MQHQIEPLRLNICLRERDKHRILRPAKPIQRLREPLRPIPHEAGSQSGSALCGAQSRFVTPHSNVPGPLRKQPGNVAVRTSSAQDRPRHVQIARPGTPPGGDVLSRDRRTSGYDG